MIICVLKTVICFGNEPRGTFYLLIIVVTGDIGDITTFNRDIFCCHIYFAGDFCLRLFVPLVASSGDDCPII